MLYIEKQEPDWFSTFKRKYPHAEYDSELFVSLKNKLREDLIDEQRGLCAYCCGRIHMNTSHNEHIEPRNSGILNDYELKNARKAVYRMLQRMNKETIKLIYMEQETKKAEPFSNVIQWYLNS